MVIYPVSRWGTFAKDLIFPAFVGMRSPEPRWCFLLVCSVKVLAANLPTCPRGISVTSREHRLYTSLRGTGSSFALGQLTSENLPAFSRPLQLAATSSRLAHSDVAISGFATPPSFSGDHRHDYPHQATASSSGVAVAATLRLHTHWAARGNISAFLEWCHDLGISQTVLFETTGLGKLILLRLPMFLPHASGANRHSVFESLILRLCRFTGT